jgi:hypothetical protein
MACRHSDQQICPQCPNVPVLNGLGFPMASYVPEGKRAVRECPKCSRLTERGQWVHDHEHSVFACADCALKTYSAVIEDFREQERLTTNRERQQRLARAIRSLEARARNLTHAKAR